MAHCYTLRYTLYMKLSFTIDEKTAKSLQMLDNAFAQAYAELKFLPEDELETLHRYARVSMIGSSTRIENALLTDSEINWIDTILTQDGKLSAYEQHEGIIKNKLSDDRERSIEEVAGCRAMLMLIYQNPNAFQLLKEVDIRALHHELLSPYKQAEKYAGNYKTTQNSVVEINHSTNDSRVVFKTADPGPITVTAMSNLLEWYNTIHPTLEPSIAITCEMVYRFLAIHPFQDGNGRLGRGLFLLCLLNANSIAIKEVTRYIAIDRFIEKYNEEYYYVLSKCSDGKFHQNPNKYNIQFFLNFMIKILHEALNNIQIMRLKYQKERELPESAAIILQCFRDNPETRMTTAKLIEQANLPRRTIIRAINLLLDAELIQKYGKGAGTRYQIIF